MWAGTAPTATKAMTKSKSGPSQTPLLSPSLTSNDGDPMARLWGDDYDEAIAATLPHQTVDDEEDEDGEPPNLAAILSTHLGTRRGAGSRRRSGSSSSGSMEPELDSPVARRQRSIRSLRAHLATARVTPGSDGVPALPALPLRYDTEEGDSVGAKLGLPAGAKSRTVLPEWLSPKPGEP